MNKILGLAFLFSGTSSVQTAISNYFKNLPIPLKHLMASRGNTTDIINAYSDSNSVKDATIYPENFFKYWINFKKIYEIQYFDGFENNNVKFPKWKTLTINKLNSSQSNVLCRIKKYTLDGFEEYFQDVAKFEMPLFDQYFYIIPDKAINLLASIQFSIKKIPEIKLPPIQLANPPPDKIGPISVLSVNKAINTALNPSLIVPKVETLGSLVSTVTPMSLQMNAVSSKPPVSVPPPSLKVSVDIVPSLQSLAPKPPAPTVNLSTPISPVIQSNVSIAQTPQTAIQSPKAAAVVQAAPALQPINQPAPQQPTTQKTIVSINTPVSLADSSTQKQNTTVVNETKSNTPASRTTPLVSTVNTKIYKQSIAKIKI